jgi:2-hydroxycyclohexanecarboxyl-CoA dehydrogenase
MAGKVALVTGAGAGIGAACAKRLAREGNAVGVLDLDQASAEKTAQEIVAAGGRAIALGASIADRGQVKAAIEKLRAAFGPITILVNNAGISNFYPFEEITDEIWDQMFEINCKGTFIVTTEVLPDMKAANWGRIVMISSSSTQSGSAEQVHYAASKGAISSMTRSLAIALGEYHVTVNNIPPGSIMQTIMSEANVHRFPIARDVLEKSLPARRLGVPEDIANACSWLCSEDSSYITGQTIGVNGGRVFTG